jgi:methyl-accepting chemotaxis protein
MKEKFLHFFNRRAHSRLKKKLSIYFILIAIVSTSVTAQIILEVSSPVFQRQITDNFINQVTGYMNKDQLDKFRSEIRVENIEQPIRQLRNRMLLMLLVITFCIIGAFTMFTRDIVVPMDELVKGTKKIAAGDLSVNVPVMSEDEIGQMAQLVNNMNIGLQDMITQMRRELDTFNVKIAYAISELAKSVELTAAEENIQRRSMKVSELNRLLEGHREVEKLLNNLSNDIMSLHSFMDMYKSYTISSEVTQNEIDATLSHYAKK